MSAHRTEAQKQAARENGKKSKGPVTEEGKTRSRRNAVKHGLADGKAIAMPPDLEAAAEREFAAFCTQYHPRTECETRLVRTAAIASARLGQLAKAEMRHTQSRVRRAFEDWDATRDAQVAVLVELLEVDPAKAVSGLKRFTEGCDWLADAWDALAVQLDETVTFDEELRTIAARLLGHSHLDARSTDPRARTLARLCQRLDHQESDALPLLQEFLRSQEQACIERGDDLWERLDSPDRAAAPELALFDPGPDYQRLMRYAAAAERTMRRALKELADGRAQKAPQAAFSFSPRQDHVPAPKEPGATKGQTKPIVASPPAPRRTDAAPLLREHFAGRAPNVEFLPISITPGTR
jgi:hypothetical protein